MLFDFESKLMKRIQILKFNVLDGVYLFKLAHSMILTKYFDVKQH
jgi:hypothetical protein